jgi:Domain of unknown function (DUF397)
METAAELSWRKSSYSSSNGGNCVEVAATPYTIAVRDSKNPGDATLAFVRDSWQAFTRRTKALT